MKTRKCTGNYRDGKAQELGTKPTPAIFIINRVGSLALASTGSVSFNDCIFSTSLGQVMFMNSSFAQHVVVVLTTLDEHHHEVEPGFTTKDNYHWTQEQEKVPHK